MLKTLTLIVSAALLLCACAAPSVEMQHDGSGSDEMLKSPCACMPVPYEGPGYTWGRG